MSERDDFGSFFAGLIVGGLVGAAVALLLAPQSGEETRATIRDRGIELKERAVEYGEAARQRALEAVEEAKERAERAIEDLTKRTEELAEIARLRAEELQSQLAQTLKQEAAEKSGTATETAE